MAKILNLKNCILLLLSTATDCLATTLLPCTNPCLLQRCDMTCCTDFTTGVVIFTLNGKHEYICINGSCPNNIKYRGFRNELNVTMEITSLSNETTGRWQCLADGIFSREIVIKPDKTTEENKPAPHKAGSVTNNLTNPLNDVKENLTKLLNLEETERANVEEDSATEKQNTIASNFEARLPQIRNLSKCKVSPQPATKDSMHIICKQKWIFMSISVVVGLVIGFITGIVFINIRYKKKGISTCRCQNKNEGIHSNCKRKKPQQKYKLNKGNDMDDESFTQAHIANEDI